MPIMYQNAGADLDRPRSDNARWHQRKPRERHPMRRKHRKTTQTGFCKARTRARGEAYYTVVAAFANLPTTCPHGKNLKAFFLCLAASQRGRIELTGHTFQPLTQAQIDGLCVDVDPDGPAAPVHDLSAAALACTAVTVATSVTESITPPSPQG